MIKVIGDIIWWSMPSMLIVLSIVWTFIYWILGGVFFSLIALLRMGRVRRTWFGCLFSFSALGLGTLAAWVGVLLAARNLDSCSAFPDADRWQQWLYQFSCGIVDYVGSALVGFLLLIVLGALLMLATTSTDHTWIKTNKIILKPKLRIILVGGRGVEPLTFTMSM